MNHANTKSLKHQRLALLWLMRPGAWLKNTFVFSGVLFGHQWANETVLASAGVAFGAFCAVASSVYVMNDLADREADRLHPIKRARPLAARSVDTRAAVTLGLVLLIGGLLLGSLASETVLGLLLVYVGLNIAYSFKLQHVPILDVFAISTGFVIRLLVGTVAIGVPYSLWILLCGLMLALFLSLGKRRSELVVVSEEPSPHRRVLAKYSVDLLDQLIGICAAATIITYSLYTVDSETRLVHHTDHLILTVPFVVFGVFRFLYRMQTTFGAGDPVREVYRDPVLLVTVVGWLVTIFCLIW